MDVILHHYTIEAEDIEAYDLSMHFEEAVEWIADKLTKTNVLVHCHAGVSRSATIVIAYLLKTNQLKMNLQKCLDHVVSCRGFIWPNKGFLR